MIDGKFGEIGELIFEVEKPNPPAPFPTREGGA